ncbi:hypothetical protein FGRMN_8151 [Fusarium graminum]|nr:hypothetical protein FGRMN_8151 [Fusarium graminum]
MTLLRDLVLNLDALDDEQASEFCKILSTTRRWDTLKSLTVSAAGSITCAILRHCNAEVLEEVNLHAWTDTKEHSALVSMYSTLESQHSLKKLGICYHRDWNTPPRSAPNGQIAGAIQATKDFSNLTSLSIYQERGGCGLTERGPEYFDELLTMLCDRLAETAINEFLFPIHEQNLQRNFIQESLGLPITTGWVWDPVIAEYGITGPTEGEFNEWFTKLVCRIGSACPRLRNLTIPIREYPLPGAAEYCANNYNNCYVCTRAPSGTMTMGRDTVPLCWRPRFRSDDW